MPTNRQRCIHKITLNERVINTTLSPPRGTSHFYLTCSCTANSSMRAEDASSSLLRSRCLATVAPGSGVGLGVEQGVDPGEGEVRMLAPSSPKLEERVDPPSLSSPAIASIHIVSHEGGVSKQRGEILEKTVVKKHYRK